MSARQGQITIYKGTDRDLNLTLTDGEGDPYDVSTATEIKALFCPASGSTLLERTLTGTQVSVVNGPGGKIKVTLDAAFTATMREDEAQDFEIEVTIGGKISTAYFKEQLNVRNRLQC